MAEKLEQSERPNKVVLYYNSKYKIDTRESIRI